MTPRRRKRVSLEMPKGFRRKWSKLGYTVVVHFSSIVKELPDLIERGLRQAKIAHHVGGWWWMDHKTMVKQYYFLEERDAEKCVDDFVTQPGVVRAFLRCEERFEGVFR